jgi:dolichyl-phosphate beta-glucosyltransferase
VYNNQDILKENIAYLFKYLKEKKYDYEIIIVDDFSDKENEVKKIADEYKCIFLRNNKNYGKGYSVKKGMLESTGEYKIFTDADIPYENESIDLILRKLEKENYDVVIGDRTLVKSEYKNVSFLRSFGSKFFSFVVWGLTSGKFGDTQCGLKGFTSEAVNVLFGKTLIKGFALDVELLYLALKRNYKIAKVPVKLRAQNVSTVSILKHGFLMLVDLIRIKLFQIRKKYE